jgi:hypothetical protein
LQLDETNDFLRHDFSLRVKRLGSEHSGLGSPGVNNSLKPSAPSWKNADCAGGAYAVAKKLQVFSI